MAPAISERCGMKEDLYNLCNHYNPLVDDGLIIIADISGFTRYLNVSEIEHGQRNIAQLLEAILDANQMDLAVSEIEGDAIFFFKFEKEYQLKELINQIKAMARSFYATRNRLSMKTDCGCRACNILQKLHLKFVLHAGNIGTIMIKNFCKLYGIDVIVAHRLLKNSIPIHDYVLFSSKIIQKPSTEVAEIFEDRKLLIQGNDTYAEIGTVNYYFVPLHSLLQLNESQGFQD